MAQLAHARHVDQYWRLIDLKRRKRKAKIAAGKSLIPDDYVHEQPPVYTGPERPAEIMAQLPKPPKPVVPAHEPVPLVADFLREADAVYGFKPDRIGEDEFMFYYALELARLGLTRDQVVRIYAFETGGMGTQDLQSGYNPKIGKAASTGLGYAQLLAANTVERVRKEGPGFVARLERLAEEPGTAPGSAEALRAKAACIRRMIADAKKIPESWPAHVAYAKTPNGLGMHALNLDANIGPWMQAVKLRDIMDYAAKKGVTNLTGAQLEAMNLAGPGSGFEMLQPPGRDAPTSNFFDQAAYRRNPVVHGMTGAQLLVKFDEIMNWNSQKEGAQKFAKTFDTVQERLSGKGRVKTSSEESWLLPFNIFGGR